MMACLPSAHCTSTNGRLSRPRAISIAPNTIVSVARILGRNPEPGNDRLPIGRSPLSAITSAPNATKAPPATWSARSTTALSLHAADLVDRFFDPLGVGVPEGGEFRLVEIRH